MRAITASLVAGVMAGAWSPDSVSILTVKQDAERSQLDGPSVSLSADGRYAAFTSCAQLVPADANTHADIYVLDRVSGRVTLESVDASDHPSISGDGRLLAFEAGGKVVLIDREQGIRRIYTDGNQPSISADGRFLVFMLLDDVFRLDVNTGASRQVSVADSGMRPRSGSSVAPAVSADGRHVAFASSALLVSASAPVLTTMALVERVVTKIYVRDMERETTVQVGARAGPVSAASWAPAISADGRRVAFVSAAANLVPADRNQSPDVFLANLDDNSLQLVSRGPKGGTANGPSSHPAISADGRFVVFQSAASDLVCTTRCTDASEDINLLWDIFVFDGQSKSLSRVSGDSAGGWMEASVGPAIDGTGALVAFSSRHPVEAADTDNDFDLFLISRR